MVLGKRNAKAEEEERQRKLKEYWDKVEKAVAEDREYLAEEDLEALKDLKAKAPELVAHKYFSRQFYAKPEEKVEGPNDKKLFVFLFARKLNVERTITMLENYINFRDNNKFHEPTDINSVDPALVKAAYTFYVPNKRDKKGRAIAYIYPARFFPKQLADPDAPLVYVTWWFDYVVQNESLDVFRAGYTYVEDLAGVGMRNVDSASSKRLSDAILNSFPIRVQSILIVNAGTIVKVLLKIARLFMKAKIIQRVQLMQTEQLAEHIPKENLLKECGGDLEFDLNGWYKSIGFRDQQQVEEKEAAPVAP